MKAVKLVFVPVPGIGHLVAIAEFAKRLLDRDQRLSVTVLVINPIFSPNVKAYTQSLAASDTQIEFIYLPQPEPPSHSDLLKSPENYVSKFIESHKPYVKDAITKLILSDSIPLAGLVIDLFCSSMIDVANELGVPSYLFFTCSAAFLGLMLYLPIRDAEIGTEFNLSDPESIIPGYENPVPASVLPSVVLNKEGGYTCFRNHGSRFKETKGIIVNTFAELEPHAIHSLTSSSDDRATPIYTVGPVLDLTGSQKHSSGSVHHLEIMKWLDHQPPSSVVFLCFGSLGSFQPPQLAETATALERSGHPFLWSIRKPPQDGKFGFTTECTNFEAVLPDGFLERNKKKGMVCGWAPQVEVLGHPAIGGFVSHCGWNSILESLWCGVPIVTWPVYGEQQINAFEMVKELELSVELRLDYRMDGNGEIVKADEIEKAIRSIMDGENPIRKVVKEMNVKSRKAVVDGGSSFASLQRFIDDVLRNKP